MLKRNPKQVGLLFLFCLVSSIGLGQDNLITKKVSDAILNESQRSLLTKIAHRETTKRYEIVDLNLETLKLSSIKLTLFDEQIVTLSKEKFKSNEIGGYTWKGSSSDKSAKLILVVKDKNAMGTLTFYNKGHKAYRIESLGGSPYVLIELDHSKFLAEKCN